MFRSTTLFCGHTNANQVVKFRCVFVRFSRVSATNRSDSVRRAGGRGETRKFGHGIFFSYRADKLKFDTAENPNRPFRKSRYRPDILGFRFNSVMRLEKKKKEIIIKPLAPAGINSKRKQLKKLIWPLGRLRRRSNPAPCVCFSFFIHKTFDIFPRKKPLNRIVTRRNCREKTPNVGLEKFQQKYQKKKNKTATRGNVK